MRLIAFIDHIEGDANAVMTGTHARGEVHVGVGNMRQEDNRCVIQQAG